MTSYHREREAEMYESLKRQHEFNVEIAARIAAILQLLFAKEVITEEEFLREQSHFTAFADQEMAKRKEEFLATEQGKAASFVARLMGVDL